MFDPSELILTSLPSVAFDARRELPDCQGIYFVLANDGAVLYIGKAKNIFNRWLAHHKADDLSRLNGLTIFWLSFGGSAATLAEVERVCIKYFSPVLNGRMRPYPKRADAKPRTFRLDNDLMAGVEQIAVEENRTVTAQLEVFLREMIKQYKKAQAERQPGNTTPAGVLV